MQTITPYLLYEDVAAAVDWLAAAFGCEERLRFTGEDGIVTHAEVTISDGEIMLGHPGPDYRSPKQSGHFSHFTFVVVDDVEAHFARAKEGGATVTSMPSDQPYGHRSYDAIDLEGHRWTFGQVMHEVAPEAWGATSAPS